MTSDPSVDPTQIAKAVADNPLWYHTLDLGHGVVTPGWFDLRPVVDKTLWPDIRGKRCLDVATYDGFFAFEMERRGAAEVIAIDIDSHEKWDWPPRVRARGAAYLAETAGEKGRGFEIAREALGSKVDRRFISVYDLPDAGLGEFDLVICGSLLLHLRDPLRALDSIRQVCRGTFISSESVDVGLWARTRKLPAYTLKGDELCQWMVPNPAGLRHMLSVSGFDVKEQTKVFGQPFGPGHPPASRTLGRRLLRTFVEGDGVPTVVARCERAV